MLAYIPSNRVNAGISPDLSKTTSNYEMNYAYYRLNYVFQRHI